MVPRGLMLPGALAILLTALHHGRHAPAPRVIPTELRDVVTEPDSRLEMRYALDGKLVTFAEFNLRYTLGICKVTGALIGGRDTPTESFTWITVYCNT